MEYGVCSLDDLVRYKRTRKIRWDEKDLFFISQKLINFCNLLYSENIFHGDIKPENVILKESSDLDQYVLRFIDFGGSSWGIENYGRVFTPNFYDRELLRYSRSELISKYKVRKNSFNSAECYQNPDYLLGPDETSDQSQIEVGSFFLSTLKL